MDKKRISFSFSIGAPSIFLIFVILAMMVLAILSYLQANSYYESSYRQLIKSSEYYESESRVLNQYYQLDANDIETSLNNYNIVYQKQGQVYIIKDKISDTRILELSFVKDNDDLKITSLKMIAVEA